MITSTYYAMKSRLGGVQFTQREKLLFKWYPTPGCKMHAILIGTRRARILFEHYHKLDKKACLIYWRTHPAEWEHIQNAVK